MGGDSAGVDSHSLSITLRKDRKVFRRGEVLIGFCGSYRMGQLLRWKFAPEVQSSDATVDQYIHLYFLDEVRRVLEEGKFTSNDKGVEEIAGNFLIGYRKNIYHVESDYQIGQPVANYAACGCGRDLILGSLYTTEKCRAEPKKRIILALEAAEEYSCGVRRPFIIMNDKGKEFVIE
jgi:ATP-dependent protease HslVU (ClpYQ) peptidase subunit